MTYAIAYLLIIIAAGFVCLLWPTKGKDLDSFTVVTLLVLKNRKSKVQI